MISVSIIGSGNVAYHLTDAFLKAKNVTVNEVFARNIDTITYLKGKTSITDNLAALKDADVFIIAVSDNAIAEVSSKIDTKNALVVHTSGCISMDSLCDNLKKGVFYPLQSFSRDKKVNFNDIPFCLETSNKKDLALLENLALSIGKKVYHINSLQRQQLHVSAVFVNNFVNHLYKIGYDICKKYKVPFEILHPLIKETAIKIEELVPEDAQTGPAKRKDTKTIQNHLDLLNEQQQKIYKILTESIQHGEKL